MQTEQLDVAGMRCGGCSRKVSEALKAVRGVDTVDVSLVDHQATVGFDPKQASAGQLELAIRNAGYGVGEGAMTQVSGCHCSAK
jgi:copper chaperone CopZ